MKTIRRCLCLCVLLVFGALCLTACGEKDSYNITFSVNGTDTVITVKKGEMPVFSGATDKPADSEHAYQFTGWDKEIVPATADTTYTAQYRTLSLAGVTVRWTLADGKVVTTTAHEGETLTPPAEFSEVATGVKYVYTFTGWSVGTGREPVDTLPAVTAQDVEAGVMVIRANYTSVLRQYTVTFRVDGVTLTTAKADYGTLPAYPGEKDPEKPGYRFAFWTNARDGITADVVCDAVFCKTNPEALASAYYLGGDLLGYKAGLNDNGNSIMSKASAVLYMVMEIRENPDNSGVIRERVLAHLKNLISGGKEPFFDLRCYWNYVPMTALIALSRATPAVWDGLTADEQSKYDLVMRSFAYVLALGTDDQNKYSTGPSMSGNFGKTWNTNYRLANVAPMIFITKYFGSAKAVNEILNAFDFDTVMGEFQTAGFTRAYDNWNTEAPVKDGVTLPGAREWMNNGGSAYHKRDSTGGRLGIQEGDYAGTGVGVRVGTYKYLGHTLDDLPGILTELIAHGYSGGLVLNDSADARYGVYVETDFLTRAEIEAGATLTEQQKALLGTPKSFFPKKNADGTVYVNELGNWEPDTSVVSPVLGKTGMMQELVASDGGDGKHGKNLRMSCAYGHHDFIMTVVCMATLSALGEYDPTTEDNVAAFRLAWVGNTDFLFKYSHGFVSFSLGKAYLSEEKADDGYLLWKAWWLDHFGDYTYDTLPSEAVQEKIIVDEDFSKNKIDSNENKNTAADGVSYGCAKKTGTSMKTEDRDGSAVLRIAQEAGAKDPMINCSPAGGLANAMTNRKKLVLTFRMAKDGDTAVISSQFRLRVGGTDTCWAMMGTSPDGKVYVNVLDESGKITAKTVTTLTNDFQDIRIVADFEAGTVSAYLGETAVFEDLTIALPATYDGKTAADYLADMKTYAFNWYIGSNAKGTVARALLLDSYSVRVTK